MKKKIFLVSLMLTFILFMGGCVIEDLPSEKVVTDETTSKLDEPTTGDTSNQSVLDNIAIAAKKFESYEGFSTKYDGKVTTSVLGIPYIQTIDDLRQITKDAFFVKSQSFSSLKDVAQERYYTKDKVLIRGFKSVKNENQVEWNDTCYAVNESTYLENYGYYPNEMSAYIINENTVLSYQDLSTDDEVIYHLVLDPTIASANYMAQVKTMANATAYPSFSRLETTIHMTKNWEVKYTENEEVYDINMPSMGTITCYLTATEKFDYQIPTIEEQSFFENYVNSTPEQDVTYEKKPMDYLQETFGDLISGDGTSFTFNVQNGDSSETGELFLSLADGVQVKARYGSIYFTLKNNQVYLMKGDKKFAFSLSEILDSEESMDTISTDIMKQLTMEEVDNKRIFTLPIESFGTLVIETSKTSGKLLQIELEATLPYFNEDIKVTAIPQEEIIYFPSVDDSYQDISNTSWIFNTIKQILGEDKNAFAVDLSLILLNGQGKIGINEEKEIEFEFVLTYLDHLPLILSYQNGMCYLEYNTTKIAFDKDSLVTILAPYLQVIGLDRILSTSYALALSDVVNLLNDISLEVRSEGSVVDLNVKVSRFIDLLDEVTLRFRNVNEVKYVELMAMGLSLKVSPIAYEEIVTDKTEFEDITNSLPMFEQLITDILHQESQVKGTIQYSNWTIEMVMLQQYEKTQLKLALSYLDEKVVDLCFMDSKLYLENSQSKLMYDLSTMEDSTLQDFLKEIFGENQSDTLDFCLTLIETINLTLAQKENSLEVIVDLSKYIEDVTLNLELALQEENIVITGKAQNITGEFVVEPLTLAFEKIDEQEYTKVNSLVDTISDFATTIMSPVSSYVGTISYHNFTLKVSANLVDGSIQAGQFDLYLNQEKVAQLYLNDAGLFFDAGCMHYYSSKDSLTSFIPRILRVINKITEDKEESNYINDLYHIGFDVKSIEDGQEITLDFSECQTNLSLLKKIVLEVSSSNNCSIKTVFGSVKVDLTLSDNLVDLTEPSQTDYQDVSSSVWLVDTVLSLLEKKEAHIEGSIELGELSLALDVMVDENYQMQINFTSNYLDQTQKFVLVYAQGNLEFKYENIEAQVKKNEISDFVESIKQLLPYDEKSQGLIEAIMEQAFTNLKNIEIVTSLTQENLSFDIDVSKLTSLFEKFALLIEQNEDSFMGKLTLDSYDFEVNVKASSVDATQIQPLELTNPLSCETLKEAITYLRDLISIVGQNNWYVTCKTSTKGSFYDWNVEGAMFVERHDESKYLANLSLRLIITGNENHFIDAYYLDGVFYVTYSTDFTVHSFNDVTTNEALKMIVSLDTLKDIWTTCLDKLNLAHTSLEDYFGLIDYIGNGNQEFNPIRYNLGKIYQDFVVNDTCEQLVLNTSEIADQLFHESLTYEKTIVTLKKNMDKFSSFDVENFYLGQDRRLNIGFDLKNQTSLIQVPSDLDSYNYMDSLSDFTEALMNSVRVKEYNIDGSLKVSILLNNLDVKASIHLSVSDTLKGYVKLEIPYDLFLTNNKTDTYVYIEDDMVYVKRDIYKRKLFGGYSYSSSDYKKETRESFENNLTDRIIYLFNLKSLIANKIKDASDENSGEQFHLDQLLTTYTHDQNDYNFKMNLSSLTHTSLVSDMNLTVSQTYLSVNGEYGPYLSGISGNLSMMYGLASVDINLNYQNIGSAADLSNIPSDLSTSSLYKNF